MKKKKQLTVPLRYQLSGLNKSTINQTKIAKQLGVHQLMISRELKRNIGKRGYRAIQEIAKQLKGDQERFPIAL